jgi:N-acetylgalactosamine kinase
MDYELVVRAFRKQFPRDQQTPALFRVPGRVNLIGEHTDYNGLPVLPLALQKEVVVAVAPRDDARVVMGNVDPRYEDREFVADENVDAAPAGDWSNYCRAAATGLWQYLSQHAGGATRVRGMNIMLHGDIPVAAGLSSSSALVVACALALLHANGISVGNGEDRLDRIELAEILARAEQYVGTRGGGMDQTVALCARKGAALKIHFFPIRVTEVPLPRGYKFVVCNSMVRAEKSAHQRELYNRGPQNCDAAAAILAEELRAEMNQPIRRLGDLSPENFGVAVGELWRRIERTLSRKAPELVPFVRHVFREGERVEEAVEALEAGNMQAFGKLMVKSHESLRDDYGVSCPELDALVDIALEAGATGSRLTGAGFGGCTVSLVPETGVSGFVSAVQSRYYGDYLVRHRPDLAVTLETSAESVIVCEPSDGASMVAI